ncbi:MAG: hypothetical protein Q8M65_10715, partial [Rhodoglobus sp.]|nr:hypothetical protein [Rhodoglobus sp.]
YLLASSFIGGSTPPQQVIVIISFLSVVLGAMLATRIRRRGVSNLAFVKGTTTVRVIAIAWIGLGFVLILVPIVEVLGALDLQGLTIANGLLGTVGSLSLLAVLGPGYAEYREALAGAKQPVT